MIAVHLADGFEEVEAITTVDLLRRADMDVVTVSVMGRKDVLGAHEITVQADALFEEINYDECEMMILPGGGEGAQNLDAHGGINENLAEFAESGKWIAAICAAPMVLGHHGLLKNRKATIYKGMESELTGAEYVDEKVVVDGNLITSQGPATAMFFVLKIIELLKNKKEADAIAEDLLLK